MKTCYPFGTKFRGLVFNIGQKGHIFEKKGTKQFTNPYSIPFQSVLHQNKALHNFHKKGAESDCQMHKTSSLGHVVFKNISQIVA